MSDAPASAEVATPRSPEGGDARLLAGLRAGEERAFEDLVRRTGPGLLATARRLLRSEAAAREAVEEAYRAAFEAIPSAGATLEPVRAWMLRVAMPGIWARLQARARSPAPLLEEYLPRFDGDGRRVRSEPLCGSALAPLPDEEVRATVRRSVDRLPEPYRTVLLLRDVDALENDEVARALDLPPGEVKRALHHARQALCTLLERALPDFPRPDRRPVLARRA